MRNLGWVAQKTGQDSKVMANWVAAGVLMPKQIKTGQRHQRWFGAVEDETLCLICSLRDRYEMSTKKMAAAAEAIRQTLSNHALPDPKTVQAILREETDDEALTRKVDTNSGQLSDLRIALAVGKLPVDMKKAPPVLILSMPRSKQGKVTARVIDGRKFATLISTDLLFETNSAGFEIINLAEALAPLKMTKEMPSPYWDPEDE